MEAFDTERTALLDRINSATQKEKEALRNALREGLELPSSLDHFGFQKLLEFQSGQAAQDQVRAAKVSLMLTTANRHLDPFRDSNQRLNIQETKHILVHLKKMYLDVSCKV